MNKSYLRGSLRVYHKRRLFDGYVLPVLTYGCQTWNLSEKQRERLDVEQRTMERLMLNVRWDDKISNGKLRKMSGIKSVRVKTKKLKWSWDGHIQRHDDSRWPKKVENWNPSGKRSSGKPKTRWMEGRN